MRRTKIVCTIGPSTDSPERIAELIEAGMDVARLNLSHGQRKEHCGRIELIRDVCRQLKKTVAILVDTRGPEVRTGSLREDAVFLEDGQDFVLTAAAVDGDARRVSVTYPGLPRDLSPGHSVLIDDGLISLRVEAINGDDIFCRVIHGGELRSYKGLNLPEARLNLPALGELDRADLRLALEQEIHFIAASFTRTREDILEIRRLIEEAGGEAAIIAKIESREGMVNFDSILDVSDGMMVARGDLGVEIPAEEVPLLQKKIIQQCNRAGKPVITATQMLDSMIRNPRPTRAEASDVANAIFDGTDAVMLSGETAIGRFPLEAVRTMSRIACRTEEALQFKNILEVLEPAMEKTVTDAISYATCHTAQELEAQAIITSTQSGHTARMVSKYKPRAPIIAVTARQRVAAQLKLTWGVYPVLYPPVESTDEMFTAAIRAALREELIREGDMVVITAGVPVGVSGTTNLLRVETVGEVLVKGTGIGKSALSGIAYVAGDHDPVAGIAEGQILVIRTTDREHLPALEKAAAVVTEEGGLTSHGAIVALNLGKPAVVGAESATDLIKTGDLITVDAVRGLIYRGKANVL
ncbi:MAG: pyruvate kinase [Bacillota bacterium]